MDRWTVVAGITRVYRRRGSKWIYVERVDAVEAVDQKVGAQKIGERVGGNCKCYTASFCFFRYSLYFRLFDLKDCLKGRKSGCCRDLFFPFFLFFLRNLSTNFRILNFFLDISWSREDLFEDFSELENWNWWNIRISAIKNLEKRVVYSNV